MGVILGYSGYSLNIVTLSKYNKDWRLFVSSISDDYVLLDEDERILLGDSGLVNSVHYSLLKDCVKDKNYRKALHGDRLYCNKDIFHAYITPINPGRVENVLTIVSYVNQADYVFASPNDIGEPLSIVLFKDEKRKELLLLRIEDDSNVSIGDKLVDFLLKVNPTIINDLINRSKYVLERYANAELIYVGNAINVINNKCIVEALCKEKPAVVVDELGLVDMVCTLEGNRDMDERKIDTVIEHAESEDINSKTHALMLLYNMNYAMYPYISRYILDLISYLNYGVGSSEYEAMDRALNEYRFIDKPFDNLPEDEDKLNLKYLKRCLMKEVTENLNKIKAYYKIDISKFVSVTFEE